MYKSHGKEYIDNNFSAAELQALMKSAPSPPMADKPITKPGPAFTKKQHPLPPIDFGCNMCGSKFLSKAKLWTHMQSHGVILIPCPTCGDKFVSQIELRSHMSSMHTKQRSTVKKRKPGPASKTNAPHENRGSTSLPTYLELTQVSRRNSTIAGTAAEDKKSENSKKPENLSDIMQKLATAAASKNVKADEKISCNFCSFVCKSQLELTQHLVGDHFKGLIPAPPVVEKCPACPRTFATKEHLESHVKSVHRAKQIRRSLGLDDGNVSSFSF